MSWSTNTMRYCIKAVTQHFQVKPVSYLMINSDTAMRTSSGQLSSVPRGTTLRFTVTYHDDVGDTFYATNVDMRYRCSRWVIDYFTAMLNRSVGHHCNGSVVERPPGRLRVRFLAGANQRL